MDQVQEQAASVLPEKDIVQGQIGTVGKYDVAFKGGALTADIEIKPVIGKLAVQFELGAKDLLDLVAAEAKAKTGSDLPVEVVQFLEKALGLV